MESQGTRTRQLQELLDRLQGGDDSARDALIDQACDRLRRLTRKLKRDFKVVSRFRETDDIFQQAVMRLYRSLSSIQPENVRAFLGLAATQIRRELVDVTRKLTGPEGLAANHSTNTGPRNPSTGQMPRYDQADDTNDPAKLLQWTEFHAQIERLPDQEREVTDLIVYQELSQADVAELLQISERTVKRRWRSAKVLLHEALQGEFPDL